MKCGRCAAEVPGQAQFCMRCGAPVTYGRPAPTVPISQPLNTPSAGNTNGKIIGAVMAVIAVLALAGFLVARNLLAQNAKIPSPGRVTDANGRALGGAGLTDANGRINNHAPLTDTGGRVQKDPDPVDVIDYLKHVRDCEAQRVATSKSQLSQALHWSANMQASNWSAEMTENPDKQHQQDYSKFQNSFSQWSTQWEQLSALFMNYPKPVPQSCIALKDKYLDVLGKTSSSMTAIANGFAQAMSGNAGAALDALSAMQGKASTDIDLACGKADSEVGSICDKYHIHKDFDIKPDGGASNPFGIGR